MSLQVESRPSSGAATRALWLTFLAGLAITYAALISAPMGKIFGSGGGAAAAFVMLDVSAGIVFWNSVGAVRVFPSPRIVRVCTAVVTAAILVGIAVAGSELIATLVTMSADHFAVQEELRSIAGEVQAGPSALPAWIHTVLLDSLMAVGALVPVVLTLAAFPLESLSLSATAATASCWPSRESR